MKYFIDTKNLKSVVLHLTLLIFLLNGKYTFAQEDTPLRTYLDIMCYQKSTGKDLKASVRARTGENQKIMPVPGLPIDFYTFNDSAEVLLGKVVSDQNGESAFTITEGIDLLLNNENGYSFKASFNGNENFKKASKELSIMEVDIEITFMEVDSVKVISAKAYEIDQSSSEKIPLDGIDLSFYVPGSFSLYKIGDVELKDGVGEVEFPVTLPGDSEGNLTIIARIEDSDDYGFVESSAKKDWGRVREPVVLEERRGLGDTDAPLWMTYTLIVLLTAVWIHYLYIFVVIYLIKKDSKTAS